MSNLKFGQEDCLTKSPCVGCGLRIWNKTKVSTCPRTSSLKSIVPSGVEKSSQAQKRTRFNF